MSASDSGSREGTPSTTAPMAGPWLSPQVVMRRRVPKLLPAMDFAGLERGSGGLRGACPPGATRGSRRYSAGLVPPREASSAAVFSALSTDTMPTVW